MQSRGCTTSVLLEEQVGETIGHVCVAVLCGVHRMTVHLLYGTFYGTPNIVECTGTLTL